MLENPGFCDLREPGFFQKVSHCLLQLAQFGKQFAIVGQDTRLVLFDPAQNALLVDYKDCTIRAPQLFVKDAVIDRHFAVGPEIGDERIRNSAERFAPRLF